MYFDLGDSVEGVMAVQSVVSVSHPSVDRGEPIDRLFTGVRSAARAYARWGLHLAFGVFIGLLLVGGSRHEPWFDEAQAWLIARDSSPWTILAHLVRYEGSPGAWHLVLWAAERLGTPYDALWLISGAFACAGAWIVLYKSPFPFWLRLGVIFSYFWCYQYAVVARSYALDLFLIPLIAALYSRRSERPVAYFCLLGLLANVNLHSMILSGPLSLELLFASRRDAHRNWALWLGVTLYALLAAAAVLQVWPPSDPDFMGQGHIQFWSARPVVLVVQSLVERWDPWSMSAAGIHLYVSGFLASAVLLSALFTLAVAANRLWICMALLGSLVLFVLFIYSNYWHSGMFYLVFILCLWVSWPGVSKLNVWARRGVMAALGLLCTYQTCYAGSAWWRDIGDNYSSSRAASRALIGLKAVYPADTFAASGFKALSVQPWFPTNLFANYQAPQRNAAFYGWRRGSGVPRYVSIGNWSALTVSRRYDWLLLSTDNDIHHPNPKPLEAIAADAGYCIRRVFPGGLIWKTWIAEPDTLILFGRCSGHRLP
jgi:hypothetical protein